MLPVKKLSGTNCLEITAMLFLVVTYKTRGGDTQFIVIAASPKGSSMHIASGHNVCGSPPRNGEFCD
jgi:hypothetical protein